MSLRSSCCERCTSLLITYRLPGIPPTNSKVEVPFTAIVNIRGDRLFHEHIAWDQASVLAQIGLLPLALPYHYPFQRADGTKCANPQYTLPVAGVETAEKLRDRNSVESNGMFRLEITEKIIGTTEKTEE